LVETEEISAATKINQLTPEINIETINMSKSNGNHEDPEQTVDFSGKGLKLDTEQDGLSSYWSDVTFYYCFFLLTQPNRLSMPSKPLRAWYA
jgi:hypothetical protein